MAKMVIAFVMMFFFSTIIAGIADGGSPGSSATTTAAISQTAANFTTTVNDTTGFDEAGYFEIGDEKIEYHGRTGTTFTRCSHSYDGTDAEGYAAGSMIYSPGTSAINSALGFNAVESGAKVGNINMISFGWNFMTKSIPRIVTWNFDYLKDGSMQYIRYFLLCISTGFIFVMAYMLLQAMGGVAQSIFNK